MSDLTSYKYFLMQVTKNNHFKKRTIVPRRPPTRTSGLAMSTVWKSMPLYCENSSMNAPNSKKQASAAEPMEYPWKKRKKGKKEKRKKKRKGKKKVSKDLSIKGDLVFYWVYNISKQQNKISIIPWSLLSSRFLLHQDDL